MTSDAVEELDRVLYGNTITSRLDGRGESDYLRSIPKRTRRRLIGAGYLTPGGLLPDVAADMIARYGGIDDPDEALSWYVKTALRAIAERRRLAHRRRHDRCARRLGFATYYERRTALAVELGYRSVWAMRVARGWTS